MKKIILIIFTVVCLTPLAGSCQSIDEIKNTVSSYLGKIDYWENNFESSDQDSMTIVVNNQLLQYLTTICKKNPATLKHDLNKTQSSRLQIITSSDGNFRIYFWDDGYSGSARSYTALAQYRDGNNKVHIKTLNNGTDKEEGVICSGSLVRALKTIKTKDGKTVYLTIERTILSRAYYMETICSYIIDHGKLKSNYPLFQTKTKTLSFIEFEVDFSAENKYPTGYEDGETKISTDNKTLSIPIIDNFSPTGKFLTYKFNGYKFVYDKNAKG